MKSTTSRNKSRVGRSIEESILLRKIEGSNPHSWPIPHRDLNSNSQLLKLQKTASNLELSSFNQSNNNQKDELIRLLQDYCRELERKNMELQSKIILPQNENSATQLSNDFPLQNNSISNVQPQIISTPESTKLLSSLSSMESRAVHLNQIFKRADPLDQRKKAATLLASCVRRYLVRRRKTRYRKALRDWRWTRCRTSVFILETLLKKQSALSRSLYLTDVRRRMNSLSLSFKGWAQETKKNLPRKRELEREVEVRWKQRARNLLKKILLAFYSLIQGSISSFRDSKVPRKKLAATVREELSKRQVALGESPLVTNQDVQHEVWRRILSSHLRKKDQDVARNVFQIFKRLWEVGIQLKKRANQHWLIVRAGKCFEAWCQSNFLQGQGLDRSRWLGPRNYQVRYNQRKVDYFAARRVKQAHFRVWKIHYTHYKSSKRHLQKLLTKTLRLCFHGWVAVSQKQRELRGQVVATWKEYGRELIAGPFRAWSNHVRKVRNHADNQMRLVRAHIRLKERKKLMLILRTWRHQALFGRTDGLYTRQMLAKSLSEQKQMTNALEKMMIQQSVSLEDCRDLVRKEVCKRQEVEAKLEMSYLEINRSRMLAHHATQDLRRLEAIIEAMAVINPRQVEFLQKLQPAFQFRDRGKVVMPPEEKKDASEFFAASSSTETFTLGPKQSAEEGSSSPSPPEPESQQQKKAPSTDTSDLKGLARSLKPAPNQNKTQKVEVIEPKEGEESQPVPSTENYPPHSSNISPEDMNLLNRVQWLLSRFPSRAPAPTNQIRFEPRIASEDDMATGVVLWPNVEARPPVLRTQEQLITSKPVLPLPNTTQTEWIPSPPLLTPNSPIRSSVTKTPLPLHGTRTATGSLLTVTTDYQDLIDSAKPLDPIQTLEPLHSTDPGNGSHFVSPFHSNPSLLHHAPSHQTVGNSQSSGSSSPISALKLSKQKRAAFEIAVASAVGAINEGFMTFQSLLLSDFGGVGAEFVASRMLLSFLDFLDTGDVSGFSVEDRRNWILFSLKQQFPESGLRTTDLSAVLDEAAVIGSSAANAFVPLPAQQTPLTSVTIPTFLRSEDGKDPESFVPVKPAGEVTDEILENSQTWRSALSALRALFPGAGNLSGHGEKIDPHNNNGLYGRISEMRSILSNVMQSQAEKYTQKSALRQGRAQEGKDSSESISRTAQRLQRLLKSAVDDGIDDEFLELSGLSVKPQVSRRVRGGKLNSSQELQPYSLGTDLAGLKEEDEEEELVTGRRTARTSPFSAGGPSSSSSTPFPKTSTSAFQPLPFISNHDQELPPLNRREENRDASIRRVERAVTSLADSLGRKDDKEMLASIGKEPIQKLNIYGDKKF